MTAGQVTNADFDRLSWHDNVVYGFRTALPAPDVGDWRCDLILDIDHIVAWLCEDPQNVRFLVAPADLVFHNVGGLKIDLDFGPDMLSEISIDAVRRKPAAKSATATPAYDWRIELHPPVRGGIAFTATGFTQTLRGEPLILEEQSLSRAQRDRFPSPVCP